MTRNLELGETLDRGEGVLFEQRLRLYGTREEGREYALAMQRDAYEWFDRWLAESDTP